MFCLCLFMSFFEILTTRVVSYLRHEQEYYITGTLIYAGSVAVKHEQKFAHGTKVRFDCIQGQKRSWKIVCYNGRWVGLSLGCDEHGQPQGSLIVEGFWKWKGKGIALFCFKYTLIGCDLLHT